jgi:tRNA G18 (ribose-2'-O)-methylase SpoU
VGEAAPAPGLSVAHRVVDDPDDPELAPFRRLTDARWRRATEAAHGFFVAESLLVVGRVLEEGHHRVHTVVVTPHAAERLGDRLGSAGRVLVAEPAVLAAVAGFDVHRGVLAAVARPAPCDPAVLLAAARRVVVLEDLTDQANLGALFRSASALGIDAVLLSPRCGDPLYRRSVRVSMGEVLRLPWARLDPWPDVLASVRAHGFELLALTPAAADPVATPPSSRRVAVLVGSEGQGLSDAALAAADRRVRIPMRPGVDSLNAAAAAAVAFAAYGLVDPPAGDEGPSAAG